MTVLGHRRRLRRLFEPVLVSAATRLDPGGANRLDACPLALYREPETLEREELEAIWAAAATRNVQLANMLLVAGWTGLRWSELPALRLRDFVEDPMPLLVVERAEPEGVQVKVTKSGRGRRVPVADRVLPVIQELARLTTSDSLLFVTDSGHQLHASAVKRTIGWTTLSQGRRIHDLRHTAACLWLARGVDLATVKSWMGHASIATTDIYLHHLGTGADRAGLDRLNSRGRTGGARSGQDQS